MLSEAELILSVITLWFLVSSQFFRDGMGPFNFALLNTHSVRNKTTSVYDNLFIDVRCTILLNLSFLT